MYMKKYFKNMMNLSANQKELSKKAQHLKIQINSQKALEKKLMSQNLLN